MALVCKLNGHLLYVRRVRRMPHGCCYLVHNKNMISSCRTDMTDQLDIFNFEHSNYIANQQIQANSNMKFSAVIAIAVAVVAVAGLVDVEAKPRQGRPNLKQARRGHHQILI
ncbi:hypothetical protein BDF22DRAFT_776928 [Syncephalis plumigaleata]|nr:hypothetical protein BDF22DRAFT_776928 [Syncephalis plumigaleata]